MTANDANATALAALFLRIKRCAKSSAVMGLAEIASPFR